MVGDEPPEGSSSICGKTLIISNIHISVSNRLLRNRLNIYGDIKSVKILKNQEGISEGLALVEFYKEIDALQALKSMNGKYFFGQVVHVKSYNQNSNDRCIDIKKMTIGSNFNNATYIKTTSNNNSPSKNDNYSHLSKTMSTSLFHYPIITNNHNQSPTIISIDINSFEDKDSRTVIIENLSPSVTANILINHLHNIGNILSCGFYDIVSLRKRKTAYITFSTAMECLNFIAKFHKQVFIDEAIIVSLQPNCDLLKYLKDKFHIKSSDDITIDFINLINCNPSNTMTQNGNINKRQSIPENAVFRVSNIDAGTADVEIKDHFLYTGNIIHINRDNIDTNNEVIIVYKYSPAIPFIEKLMNNTRFHGQLLKVKRLS